MWTDLTGVTSHPTAASPHSCGSWGPGHTLDCRSPGGHAGPGLPAASPGRMVAEDAPLAGLVQVGAAHTAT